MLSRIKDLASITVGSKFSAYSHADLAHRFERSESELLQGVVRQAGLAREIAGGLATSASERLAGRPGDAVAIARRAKRFEEKADRIAVDLRAAAERFRARDRTRLLIDTLEDSIDDLEEAAFFLSLLPAERDAPALEPLAALCETAAAGAEAVARGRCRGSGAGWPSGRFRRCPGGLGRADRTGAQGGRH